MTVGAQNVALLDFLQKTLLGVLPPVCSDGELLLRRITMMKL